MCSDVKLGEVYIKPVESPRYGPSPFGAVNARCVESGMTVLRDLSARVGPPRITDDDDDVYEYNNAKGVAVNSHGQVLPSSCENNKMLVSKHLKRNGRTLGGNLLFNRRYTW